MNDVAVGIVSAVTLFGAVLAFALFHVYGGLKANLYTANIGEVYNFEYLQPKSGDKERHLIKVLGVQVLSAEQIRRLNEKSRYRRYDNDFQRTSHLVTGQSPDGTIRNFYAERVVNCRRPLLAPSLFKAGVANLFL